MSKQLFVLQFAEGKGATIDIGNGDGPVPVSEIAYNAPGADFYTFGYAFNPKDAAELVKRWNAHEKLVDALTHIAGHWKARDETGDEDHALDLASCEICQQLARTAIAKANL